MEAGTRTMFRSPELEKPKRSRLGDLYLAHADAALRLAYLLTGDRALADDLVKDAFVYLAGRLSHLRNPDSFDAYLRRTVVNLVKMHFRRRKVELAYLERAARDSESGRRDPDLALLQTLRAALIHLPIANVPPSSSGITWTSPTERPQTSSDADVARSDPCSPGASRL